jgi:hypothetical protein
VLPSFNSFQNLAPKTSTSNICQKKVLHGNLNSEYVVKKCFNLIFFVFLYSGHAYGKIKFNKLY